MSSNPFRRILVPIDGSDCSEVATDFALRLAGSEGEVLFANVIDTGAAVGITSTPYGGDPSILIDALEADRRDLFAAATARARAAGVAARTVDLDGAPDLAILERCTQGDIDAIVMGTHGRRGFLRMALGSVADGVLRRSPVPTFVVRAQSRIPAEPVALIRRIVAAVDDSQSAAAAAFAVELAARYGAAVTLVHVEDGTERDAVENELERAIALAAPVGVRTEIVRAYGKPSDAIATTAAVVHADLVVIGTQGRSGADRVVLGSVAEGVVLTSPVPVVVVHAMSTAATS